MGVFKFHGHIDKNFDKELNKSDAIIVCNNIDLGNRVRILTALSNKTLVVTHRANIRGIPELIHNYNCLVGNKVCKTSLQKGQDHVRHLVSLRQHGCSSLLQDLTLR
jgi:hypothetical protein